MDNKAFLHMINSEEYIKLYDYYNQKTFMDILGVSRRENEHSNFLAWLFNPSENHGMDDYPLKKLLQTIAFRRKKDDNYNSVEPKNLLNKKYDKYIDDFIYDNFRIESVEEITREKVISNQKRLDLFIRFEAIFFSPNEKETINLLIENKITSSENDNQTNGYAKWLLEQDGFVIPIYLGVATNNELKETNKPKLKPKNAEFMVLNYQYMMDGIFEPCLLKCKTEFGHNLIKEYIACLGKALEVDTDKNPRNLVMATSKYEKKLVEELWNNHKIALIEQFDKHSSPANNSSKEAVEFYIAVAETLRILADSERIHLDDAESVKVGNMKKEKSVSKIYCYDGKNYKKYQRENSIGALCRELIKVYAKGVDYQQLEDMLKIDSLQKNPWLRGVVLEETQKDSLGDCSAYDPNKKCNTCSNKKHKGGCCRQDFEDHFFAEDQYSDKKLPSTKDGKDFYIARYFTVENLEDIIDKLGFKNEVKIF